MFVFVVGSIDSIELNKVEISIIIIFDYLSFEYVNYIFRLKSICIVCW